MWCRGSDKTLFSCERCSAMWGQNERTKIQLSDVIITIQHDSRFWQYNNVRRWLSSAFSIRSKSFHFCFGNLHLIFAASILFCSYENVINDWSQSRMNDFRRWLASNEIGIAPESPTRIYLMRHFWYLLSFVIPIIGHFERFSPICYNKICSLVPNEFPSFFSFCFAFCQTNFRFPSFFLIFWRKCWKCEMSTETNLNRNRFGATNQSTKENLLF